jgi:3-hydroxyacyl-CoA dehydrogenase/enoyl-CoA hydratase/3-hydroxybutyryl-CoA epimerase
MQDLKDRLLYRQAVETARCLSEGVLTTVHDANIGSIFGIGFPAYTGGAMQFIYGMGIDAFIARADVLAHAVRRRLCADGRREATIRQHEPRW